MKEQILKYIELKPKVGYYELSMTFGLSLDNLFELLNITNYKIEDNYVDFYDSNDNGIYSEELDGYWEKYEYDNNGNETYFEDSNGYWVKYEYGVNGNRIYYEDSDEYIFGVKK